MSFASFISFVVDVFLHLNEKLGYVFGTYSTWAYVILFLLIFCETGLVVTPFLPGDSVIFATGALAAATGGAISVPLVLALFYVAAVGGDTVNYQIGHFLRDRVQNKQNLRLIKPEYLERTHRFFERHGGKTIIIARFVPIIRTFAPFVAGVGTMSYKWFISYNVIGGLSWVTLFFGIGYFFGNIPFIQTHFSLIVLAIIFISVLPAVFAFLKSRTEKSKQAE